MRSNVGSAFAPLGLAALFFWSAPIANAQAESEFDLPAQPLADSLRAVASRTNTNLLFDAPLVAGREAPPLKERLTAEQAFRRLLAGTGIGYQRINDNTFILRATNDKSTGGSGAGASGSVAGANDPSAAAPSGSSESSPAVNLQYRAQNQAGGRNADQPSRKEVQPAISEALQEVVVTAQKRTEKLLDVPMSLSVVPREALERAGATSLVDIASTVPGMATAQFSPGQNHVELRGISSLQGLPTVGLYLDELPLNVFGGFPTYGADIRFIDLERVEVLRGPQGTLYGEGSEGGTINYITRNPDLKVASVGIDTAFGSTVDGSNLYRGNLIVNVPIVNDSFGIRFAGGYERSPGWIDYTALGKSNANDGTSKTARVKSLWKVSDSFSMTLLLMDQDTDLSSDNLGSLNRTAPFLLLTPYIDKNRLGSLVLNYDAGPFTILSATGYMDRTSNQTLDFTTLLGPFYAFLGVPPGSPQYPKTVAANATFNFKSFSEEIRFASKGDSALTWTTGLYYRDYWESGTDLTVATPNPLPFELLNSFASDESRSEAVFGQADYHFTKAFDTTLGLRYFRDKRSIPGGPGGTTFGTPVVTPAQEATFTSVDPRLAFSYHVTTDALLYTSVAKGFRSGGMNGSSSSALLAGCHFPVDFDPETLWTYEAGSNLSAAGGRIVFQGSVYYNDWQKIQELQYCPGLAALGPLTVSGGRAKGQGFDLQTTLRPVRQLTVSLAASYNNSYYEDNSAAHHTGDRIDYVPRWTGAASGDYDFNWTAAVAGRAHFDYQYTGSWSIALRNQLATPTGAVFSDSYGLLNARLSALRGSWELLLFAQNLTDNNKMAIPKYGGYLEPTLIQPRTIGVGLRYNLQ